VIVIRIETNHPRLLQAITYPYLHKHASNEGYTMQRRILRTPEAAQYIGLSVSSLEKMRLTGSGPPFIELGPKAVGYGVAELEQWVESRIRRSTSDEGPARLHGRQKPSVQSPR
jgi:predicted DNA-binding transcriptional regulator AlpA